MRIASFFCHFCATLFCYDQGIERSNKTKGVDRIEEISTEHGIHVACRRLIGWLFNEHF